MESVLKEAIDCQYDPSECDLVHQQYYLLWNNSQRHKPGWESISEFLYSFID